MIREAERNYDKEVEALHKKQYESLPKEKQYAGNKTVEQLLKELAVVDEGFSYDIENLTFRMSHLDFGKNMYSDMYKYNKKKVL